MQGWDYDALNRVENYANSIDDATTYTYDGGSQLIGADGAVTGSYEYDANGNRIATDGATSQVGPGNRLASDGTYNYTYDAEGNMIRRVNASTGDQFDLTYDYRNRLIEIIESFGDPNDPVFEITYRYDTFDRLVWRVETNYHDADGGEGGSGQTTTTVDIEKRFYDGDHVVLDFIQHEWSGSTNLEHRYLYGPAVDQVLAQENVMGPQSLDPVRWMLTDNQGTVRDVIDEDGQALTHYKYDAYGQILSGDKSLTRYLYTGRDFDATTGLQYNRARWYDSFTGRWTTQDPIGFAGGDGNLYRYVKNSPTNFTDPTGLTVFDATRSYLQNAQLALGQYMNPGDSVIKTAAGTIGVQSLTLDNPNVGNTIGPNRDKTYEQAKCVLGKLGFPLPASQNGVYWAALSPAFLGYTVDWTGFGGNRLSYSFVSNRYKGASIKSQLFEDFVVTLYHEVKGHNVDGAQHNTPQETTAFDAAYDARVQAAIAAAKANGSWDKIINCDCVKPK